MELGIRLVLGDGVVVVIPARRYYYYYEGFLFIFSFFYGFYVIVVVLFLWDCTLDNINFFFYFTYFCSFL